MLHKTCLSTLRKVLQLIDADPRVMRLFNKSEESALAMQIDYWKIDCVLKGELLIDKTSQKTNAIFD